MKDQAKFQADFVLDQKAAVREEDGDLIIEGYAADWLMDRQEEAFEPGAFEEGLKSFIERNPILVYHHQYDKALGQVIEADNRPDGLWVKARVDAPADGSWAQDVYNKIKRGTIRGFSVGGIFHRREGPDGKARIHKADFAELSVTPFPVNPRTLFAVAGKAFEEDEIDEPKLRAALELRDRVLRLQETFEEIERKAAESQRAKWAKSGVAMQDGSFPITHCGTDSYSNGAARARLHSAKGKSESAIMAHIQKREKALGCKSGGADDS